MNRGLEVAALELPLAPWEGFLWMKEAGMRRKREEREELKNLSMAVLVL